MKETKKTISEKISSNKETIKEKSDAKISEGKERFSSLKEDFIKKMSSETKELEEKITHLPINKKLIFFIGSTILLCALLGLLFGGQIAILTNTISLIVGIGMMYAGFSEQNPISKWIQETAEKEKNEKPQNTKK